MTGPRLPGEPPAALSPREWAEALLLAQRMDAGRPGGPDPRDQWQAGEQSGRQPGRDDPPETGRPIRSGEQRSGAAAGGAEAGAATVTEEPPADRAVVRPPGAPAVQMPPVRGDDPGRPQRERDVLEDPLGLGRSLRPFGRPWYSHRDRALDEEATAVRAAELGVWDPVLRDLPSDWFDVALVVEHSTSMLPWQGVARALAELLRQQGAFRDVRVWRVDTWEPGTATLYADQGSTARTPRELLHPERRRLVLLMSDCVGEPWNNGALPGMLRTWAAHQPVAVVHPLPNHLWDYTENAPVNVRLRASAGGIANAALELRADLPELLDEPAGPPPVPVPVLELEPGWLTGWARLVTGLATGWTESSVLLLEREHDGLWSHRQRPPAEPEGELSAVELVRRFLATASPEARRLAARLALVPLTLNVMRAVQALVLPGAGPLPLAEIMLGGLLERTWSGIDRRVRDGEVGFDFPDGVRSQLLGTLGRTELFRALHSAPGVAARVIGARDDLVQRLLVAPGAVRDGNLSEPERELAGALYPAFLALGHPYAEAAESARSATKDHRPGSVSAPEGEASPQAPGAHTPGGPRVLIPFPTSTSRVLAVEVETAAMAAAPDSLPVGNRIPDPVTVRGPASSGTLRVPIMGQVPLPIARFSGREAELEALHSALVDDSHAAVLPQALYGLGGVGKSQLAIEYIRRHAADYELIWWVDADQIPVIRSSYTELALSLGLEGSGQDGLVERVIRALSQGRPVKRWLLVLDNAAEPDKVIPFIPVILGAEGAVGHVIITSRDASWADQVRAQRVGVFKRHESIEFLCRRDEGMTPEEADSLAEVLDDLPLALEHAAAGQVMSGRSAPEYLELLESNRRDLLSERTGTGGTLPVSMVWQASMQSLQEANPGALELLRLLAFFGPDPVPRSFLRDARLLQVPEPLSGLLREQMSRDRAIRDINRYSLLQTDTRARTVQLHRLVRAVLQDGLSGAQQAGQRRLVHEVLTAHDPGDPQSSENWERYREMLPHIQTTGILGSDVPEARWTVLNVARYLFARADYASCMELSQQLRDLWGRQLGEDHVQTLAAARRLGVALWAVGDYQRAAALNQDTLARLRRALPDSEDAVTMAGAVAADLRATGEFREALALDQDAYRRGTEHFGATDPVTMQAGHNYAVSLRMNGRFAEALTLDRGNAEQYAMRFGPASQLALLAINNVARDLRECGRYAESVSLQEGTVAAYRTHYGEDHPDTMRAVKNLSVSYRKAGQREQALELALDVLERYRLQLGPEHLDTLAATANLANDLRLKGDLQEARRYGSLALRLYRTLMGEEHPFRWIAALNQATVLRADGEHLQARSLDEGAVGGLGAVLGDDHPWLQAARINLATDLALAGDPGAGSRLTTVAVDHLTGQYGDAHPLTLLGRRNLALDLATLGESGRAADLLAAVRELSAETLGDEHPDTRAAVAGLRAECDIEPPPI